MKTLLVLACLISSRALAARDTAPPSVQALAADAHQTVHAKVISAETTREGPRVRTRYRLRPQATLSGPRQLADFDVVLPGGVLGGEVTVQVHGVPVWTVDDEVIVFRGADGHVDLDAALSLNGGRIVDALAQDRPAPASLTELRTQLQTVAAPGPER